MESRAGYLPGFVTGLFVGAVIFLAVVKLAAAW
jgi:hypothetical protein